MPRLPFRGCGTTAPGTPAKHSASPAAAIAAAWLFCGCGDAPVKEQAKGDPEPPPDPRWRRFRAGGVGGTELLMIPAGHRSGRLGVIFCFVGSFFGSESFKVGFPGGTTWPPEQAAAKSRQIRSLSPQRTARPESRERILWPTAVPWQRQQRDRSCRGIELRTSEPDKCRKLDHNPTHAEVAFGSPRSAPRKSFLRTVTGKVSGDPTVQPARVLSTHR